MTKAKRRFLLALVQDLVCEHCQSAPALRAGYYTECGPCHVKRIDASSRREVNARWR